MLRTFLVLLSLAGSFPARAEIRRYIIDQVMEQTADGKTRLVPMKSVEGKPMKEPLVVAGLGTSRVTAQFHNWALVFETRVYPWTSGARPRVMGPNGSTSCTTRGRPCSS
jgi:hypothetical protein